MDRLMGKKGRNRLSLILQFASSSSLQDLTSSKARSVSSPIVETGLRSSVLPVPSSDDGPTDAGRESAHVTTSTFPSSTPSHVHVFSPLSPPSIERAPSVSSTRPEVGTEPEVPPTTNELDAEEKRRLLKKARKLSQMLGELPVGAVSDQEPVTGAQHSIGRRASKTLSWSAAHFQTRPAIDISPPLPPRPSLQLTMKPALKLRTPSASAAPPLSPVPDIGVRSQQTRRPSIDPSVYSRPSTSHASEFEHTSSVSNASQSSLPRSFKQHRRTKSTKHSDSTGLNYPLEPMPLSAATDKGAIGRVYELPPVPPKDKWRRQTMAAALPRPSLPPRPHSAKGVDSSPPDQQLVRRTRSLWARKSNRTDSLEDIPATPVDAAPLGPMSEKQRALSVRRGRKLAQLFGSDPPPALYHVSAHVEQLPRTPDDRRDSIATLISVSSNDILPLPSPRPSRHRSHSSMSSVATEPPSPAPLPPRPHSSKGRKSESDQPRASPNPPPFAELVKAVNADVSSPRASHEVEDSAAFRQRRLRAAKLSRFFGVAYTDLTHSLAVDPIASPMRRSADSAMQPSSPVQTQEVDVRIQERTGFWGRADERAVERQEADMNDVIAKLRQMRAAT
ncbi:hypothetical protein BV25DRAFT_1987236 [Artomyces pyxidatus]|uniref:Uncharacterized protein n=1 Tax=Artomyces pyxidatus TaxID=48021 RepID=A0ACB8TJ15_9AGAM|nr:hypothetical protein BV25DRAFT_1987236 [Artomyces pyxidatus]